MTERPQIRPVDVTEIAGFDAETDVVVVGFGIAGGAAALEARRAGAEVIVLERAGGPGGSSAMSGGELYLGGGTAVQADVGVQDDPDAMYRYLSAALGPDSDLEKLRLYCDGSVELFEWFRSHGIEFKSTMYDDLSWVPPTDDGLMWLGENASPYSGLAKPAPRGHRPAVADYGGWVIMEKLAAVVSQAGAQTITDALATNLVIDNGRVVGVLARRYGKTVAYRGHRGIVLATGGFVDNEEMLAHHAPILSGHGKVSDGLDDGSGIQMASALGAATRRMAVTQLALNIVPAITARGILVNSRGQRFVAEDSYPGHVSVEAIRHQPGPYFTVIDERGFEETPEAERFGTVPTHVEETVEALEKALGMLPYTLQETVARYNHYAALGEDPVFGKQGRWLRPLEPPFAAIDPRQVRRAQGEIKQVGTGVIGFTLGGLHTSVDGEVLDVTGQPVPGLFAAGRVSSGIHGSNYISGTSLGDGAFFGRRAGIAASREGA